MTMSSSGDLRRLSEPSRSEFSAENYATPRGEHCHFIKVSKNLS